MNHRQDTTCILILPYSEVLQRTHLLLVRKIAGKAIVQAHGLCSLDAQEKGFAHQSTLKDGRI